MFLVSESTLAEWLDTAITDRKITQNAVATYCGVSSSAVSEWRHGKRIPDPPYVAKLAEYFKWSLDDLMRRAGHLPRALAEQRSPYDALPDWARLIPALSETDRAFVERFVRLAVQGPAEQS